MQTAILHSIWHRSMSYDDGWNGQTGMERSLRSQLQLVLSAMDNQP